MSSLVVYYKVFSSKSLWSKLIAVSEMHIGRGTKPPHNLDIELLPLLGLHTTLVVENSNCTIVDVER